MESIHVDIAVPPFGDRDIGHHRYSVLAHGAEILTGLVGFILLRILLQQLGDDIIGLRIVQSCGQETLERMSQFEIMRKLRLQVWVALAISERIEEENEGIQIIIVGTGKPAAISKPTATST